MVFQCARQLLGEEGFPLLRALEIAAIRGGYPVGVVGEGAGLRDDHVDVLGRVEVHHVLHALGLRVDVVVGGGGQPVHALLGTAGAVEQVQGGALLIKVAVRGDDRQRNLAAAHGGGGGGQGLNVVAVVLALAALVAEGIALPLVFGIQLGNIHHAVFAFGGDGVVDVFRIRRVGEVYLADGGRGGVTLDLGRLDGGGDRGGEDSCRDGDACDAGADRAQSMHIFSFLELRESSQ